MNFKTFLVGGAVRDKFLGLPCKDLDFVVLAPTFGALRDALLADGCKIFTENPKCLTIRAKHPKLGCVDFACGRKDGQYTDGRRPDDTCVTTDLSEDLARRDFTCNAIAINADNEMDVADPFCGIDDIAFLRLRCVGSARARFDEDKLRPFRAIRFAVTKGMTIDHEISNAIGAMTMRQFDAVSHERIRDELLKAFRHDAFKSFRLLTEPCHSVLWEVIQNRGIWFRPTTEDRK